MAFDLAPTLYLLSIWYVYALLQSRRDARRRGTWGRGGLKASGLDGIRSPPRSSLASDAPSCSHRLEVILGASDRGSELGEISSGPRPLDPKLKNGSRCSRRSLLTISCPPPFAHQTPDRRPSLRLSPAHLCHLCKPSSLAAFALPSSRRFRSLSRRRGRSSSRSEPLRSTRRIVSVLSPPFLET